MGLYKGLGAVTTGIVPKMAIRFTSFEAYKKMMADKETGAVSGQATFLGTLNQPPTGLSRFFRLQAGNLKSKNGTKMEGQS